MTATLNRIQLIGHLGSDPQYVTSKEGQSFVTATLATNDSYKLDENWHKNVEWHQLVFFGKQSAIAELLQKGSQVFIEGRLRSNTWTDKEGQRRKSYNIIVNNLQLLGQKKCADDQGTHPMSESEHMAEIKKLIVNDAKVKNIT